MGNWIVEGQMIIFFALIFIGFFLYKSKHLSDETARQLSWIVVNITNPITLLCAALKDENKVPASELGVAFGCFVLMYIILIPLSFVIPLVLGVEKEDRYSYRMLSTFNNVGFIGIPFCAAVLGTNSLIFVSICGIVFNLIAYTYGAASLKKVAGREGSFSLKEVVNVGTVAGLVTIAVYLMDLKMPEVVGSTLNHIGNCTTFLSMIVLGVSVAKMVPAEVFGRWRLYVFVILRQIFVPILVIFIMRALVGNDLIIKTVAVLAAMPCANLPLMMAKQFGVRDDTISAGIILTTLAAIVTIPVVMIV